jgi:hypothetical protein
MAAASWLRHWLAMEAGTARDLVEAGGLPDTAEAREEWRALAVHAGVRAWVAVGGFTPATADAVDAMHAEMLALWERDEGAAVAAARAARIAVRHEEYGRIATALGAAGAHTVPVRLGRLCLRHAGHPAPDDRAAHAIGDQHEAMVDALTTLLGGAPGDEA